ncbi:MAG: helix-turn-helix domain-containing protein [Actinomycetota bacterium]|nr:helix-turn-helix domain-containing protein [Actinomycetota bacterium]
MVSAQPPSSDGVDRLLTLQEAADGLKVHYMTAYRWVRKGELPAFKAGGRLRVRTSDLAHFMTQRRVDVASPLRDPGRTDWPLHVDRLVALLLMGKGVDAGGLVRKVVADGAAAGDVYLHLVAPALHRVGEAWAKGEATVADEHRATEIAAAVMARLGGHFRRRGPSRGTAITMTPPGDQHALGSAMAADFLRAASYDVHHLGPNVPLDDLRLFLQVVPTDVVCVSITTSGLDPSVYPELVNAASEGDGATVVVGGQGADAAAAEAAGAVYLERLQDLTQHLEHVAGGR